MRKPEAFRSRDLFAVCDKGMSEIVYKGFTQDEMEFHFDPSVAVVDQPRWAEERSKASLKVRDAVKAHFNIPYGSSPRQVMDIFPAEEQDAPVFLYIHGGYWRRGSKEDNCHFAELFTKAGVTVAVLEYDLCPKVTVTDIVRQARSAVAWSYRHISEYRGDPSKLCIGGLSAGGHLVAMALAHDWKKDGLSQDIIKGAVAISGVYDLDAVLHINANKDIRLNQESVRDNSPFLHPPLPHTPLIIAVGGAEPRGWKEMSRDFFELCEERGLKCDYIEVSGANHFSISLHLSDPASPLTRAIFKQMKLSVPSL